MEMMMKMRMIVNIILKKEKIKKIKKAKDTKIIKEHFQTQQEIN